MSSSVLNTQHTSLQFSDNKHQQYEDVYTLFAKGKRFPIKTGTEAGPETFLSDALKEFAKEFNHMLVSYRSNWIAVDKKIIVPGSASKGRVFVASNDMTNNRGHDRAFPTLAFNHVDPRLGRIGQASVHYNTHGNTPDEPNHDINKMYAEKNAAWMQRASRFSAISFTNGDFNMVDKVIGQDWAFGLPFTSMADELKAWQNTGHGPIDGFCSYDKDRRVKAKRFVVLDDSELHMNSDHYVCRGSWTVKHLKLKK